MILGENEIPHELLMSITIINVTFIVGVIISHANLIATIAGMANRVQNRRYIYCAFNNIQTQKINTSKLSGRFLNYVKHSSYQCRAKS